MTTATNPIKQSLAIASVGQPDQVKNTNQKELALGHNVRRGTSKVLDYLATANKQRKIAGALSRIVGSSLKYNIKHNPLGLAVGFIGGYAGSGKVGDGISGMGNNYHVLPGIDPSAARKHLGEKHFTERSEERRQILQSLLRK